MPQFTQKTFAESFLAPHAGQKFGADKPTPREATGPMVIEASGGLPQP